MSNEPRLRDDARAIWDAAVAAVEPGRLVRAALPEFDLAGPILVVGGGKAGTAMAVAVEDALADRLDHVSGWVNVPAGTERRLARIVTHPARPAGSNHPAAEGVAGVAEMLARIDAAGPGDAVLCLLSGGGSALLPCPADGVTLDDKQRANRVLHACGATIAELNCVRKHLSGFKGGRLAQRVAARGARLVSLILSDVVGDPLDVIASGPTAADPTTFADALAVLDRYGVRADVPAAVVAHLERGRAGDIPETLKADLPSVTNRVIGSNRVALAAAAAEAVRRGYHLFDLGAFLEGETAPLAVAHAGLVRSVRRDGVPVRPPACILSGGETTVTLSPDAGKGGRNQEFVLTALVHLGAEGMRDVCVLSGGTDGEDGPTDAAGAVASAATCRVAGAADHLRRHDAYPFFAGAGDLLLTGPTGTNVADVRVVLVR